MLYKVASKILPVSVLAGTVHAKMASISSKKILDYNNYNERQNVKKFTVYVTRSDMPENGIEILKNAFQLKMYEKPNTVPRKELLQGVAGVHGIFCTLNDKIDREVLNAAGRQLKVVATMSVGYDHIDTYECKRRGIHVGYTPNVLTDATAELTMALLLAIARRLPEAQREAMTGGWQDWAPTWLTGQGISGSIVGIVGFGRIGQAVARRIKAFNPAKIVYFNRSERPEAEEIGCTKVSFDRLLQVCDFVICCSAYAPETKHLFNQEAFEKMKRSAIFINTSRGALVNQDDLIEALKNNQIGAAGLDVVTPEPLPLDNPLFNLKNCIVLPHIGSATIETRNTMSEMTALNILAALQKTELPAEVPMS